jgi:hypothetical protein
MSETIDVVKVTSIGTASGVLRRRAEVGYVRDVDTDDYPVFAYSAGKGSSANHLGFVRHRSDGKWSGWYLNPATNEYELHVRDTRSMNDAAVRLITG